MPSRTTSAPNLAMVVASPLGGVDRRDHRLQVAPILVAATRVGEEELHELVVEHAPAYKLARRDAQSLLMDLLSGRRDARRSESADVRAVDEAPGDRDQVTIVEQRLEQVDVRKMRDKAVGRIRVVGDDHVPGAVVAGGVQGVAEAEPGELETPIVRG